MDLSRRDFTVAAGAAVALTILGCDKSAEDAAPAPTAGGPPPLPPGAPAPGGPPMAGGPPSAPGPGGPGGPPGAKRKIPLADKPFSAGAFDQYKAPGVYSQFRDTDCVVLVNDGKTLVAINATCTHTGCATSWSETDKQFNCPCHKSHFDMEGNIIGKAPAKRPLEHLAIALVAADGAAPDAKPTVVQVDPTKRFHGENDQWSDPAAAIKLT